MVVVIYLIALPVVLLAAAGWVSSIFLVPSSSRNWLMAAASVAFSAMLIWRLWLNLKATGRAGPFPPLGRFWRVFAPLGVLAAAGLCLMAMGVGAAVLAAATWNSEPPLSPVVFVAFASVLISVGGCMCWPFVRLLLRKPSMVGSQAERLPGDGI